MDLSKYFVKAELIPAIIVEEGTNEVLMLAYMNLDLLPKRWKQGILGFTAVRAKALEQGRNLRSYPEGSLHLFGLRR
mgnify:FL=1